MNNYLIIFLAAFSALFTIVSPFSTASVFLTITRGDSKEKRLHMVKKACITGAVVLMAFAIAGSSILEFFSITIDAFKIAGGIIVGTLGFKMVYAKREHLHTEKAKKEAIEKEDVSIIPLAIPMMTGPGAMTTGIVLMGEATGPGEQGAIILAIIAVFLCAYLILSKAPFVDKYLGETGRLVIDKIMGLIVLVVGVQFIVDGIGAIVGSWAAFW
ncbi:MarC family protein [Candidatus Woesearchaeota archaeon]|nr:MarC family protein [Candidatus Woesearchaeota archaeon]